MDCRDQIALVEAVLNLRHAQFVLYTDSKAAMCWERGPKKTCRWGDKVFWRIIQTPLMSLSWCFVAMCFSCRLVTSWVSFGLCHPLAQSCAGPGGLAAPEFSIQLPGDIWGWWKCETLTDMQFFFFIDVDLLVLALPSLQEIPRTPDHAPSKTFYLFSVNRDHVAQTCLRISFKVGMPWGSLVFRPTHYCMPASLIVLAFCLAGLPAFPL